MVRLVTYPDDAYSEQRMLDVPRMDARPLLSDWRATELTLIPAAAVASHLSMPKNADDSETDEEFPRFRRPFKSLADSHSERSFKSIDRTVSEYWRDVLRYHWPIVIQSVFLVAAIITLGPWIGSTCNDRISDDRSIMWRLPIISELKTSLDLGDTLIPKPTCTHGFCCFSQNIEGSSSRRRASFLRRNRVTKALDDF